MEFKEAIKTIYQKKWLIFWLTFLGAVLFFDLAVLQTPQYRASSRILVIQKQVLGQDIYSISKSAQYLSKILREGIYSDSFFEKVRATDFPSELKKRRQEWRKSVKVRIVRDLGIVEIDVFRPDKEKAEQISRAITGVLENSHRFYHGGGENVELRVLDQPLVTQKPVMDRLWLGSIIGALFGFLTGSVWIFREKPKEACSPNRKNSSV